MRTLLIVCGLGMLLCCGGCRAVVALASPTVWEMKTPAEYKLADNKPARLLILVDQQAWATSEANIRFYLTEALSSLLEDKVDIKRKTIVPYKELADFRNNTADFSMLTPVEVGRKLNAQMVLYIVIDNFGLYGLSDAGYYKGLLDVRSGLYDVKTGQMVWPESGDLKASSVSFEAQRGLNEAATRLSMQTGRCIVRNFYDCPKPDYRVSDESVKE